MYLDERDDQERLFEIRNESEPKRWMGAGWSVCAYMGGEGGKDLLGQ